MIIDFKIRNYRSFKDEVFFSMEAEASKQKPQNFTEINLVNESQLRLLKIAVAFGSNASGKSNLIRAFYHLINFIVRKPQVNTKISMYDPFLFDTNTLNADAEFELNFIGPDNIRYTYKVVYNGDSVKSENLNYFPNGKSANVFARKSSIVENSNIDIGVLGPQLGKKEIRVFSNQLLLSKFGDDEPIEQLTNLFLYFKRFEVINAANFSHKSYIKNQVDIVTNDNKGLFTKLNALIRFADTKLKGFIIHNSKDQKILDRNEVRINEKILSPFMLYGLHSIYTNLEDTGEIFNLPFDSESTGTQVLYSIGGKVLLTLETGGSLIIDELDTSLHPFLTRMIVLMFQSEKLNPLKAQLIFTTHDMTLLDRDLVRRDQVWITEKNEMGISEIFSLQQFDGVREETPFDKWYLAGKFGGLPELKSVDSIFDDASAE